jgi:hypothetical protein
MRVSCFFLFCVLALRIDCTEDRVISANGDNWMKMVKWHRSYRRFRIVLVLTVNEDPAMKEAPPVDDDGPSSKVCDFWNLYKLNNITAVRKTTRALKSLHSIFTTFCFVLCSYERVSKIRLSNLCTWVTVNMFSRLLAVKCLSRLNRVSSRRWRAWVDVAFSSDTHDHLK